MAAGAVRRKFRFFRRDKADQNLEEKPAPRVDETCEVLSSASSTGLVVGALPVEALNISVPEQLVVVEPANPHVAEACKVYMQEVQKLADSCILYQKCHAVNLSVDTADMKSASNQALVGMDFAKSADIFGMVVSDVLRRRELRNANTRSVAAKVGHVLSKLYPMMRVVLGVFQAATDVVEFLPAKVTVNGLAMLFQLANDESKRGAEFEKKLKEICFQASRIRIVLNRSQQFIGDVLQEKSLDLMSTMVAYFTSSLHYFGGNYFQNLGRSIIQGADLYTDVADRVDLAIKQYDQALLLQMADLMFDQAIETKLLAKQREKTEFLQWLAPSHQEVASVRFTNTRRRTPGTLEWVLYMKEFETWRLSTSTDTASVLWLNGPPGVGKSIITTFIVDLLEETYPESIVLLFICKSGDPKLMHVHNIITTLAYQLCQKLPGVEQHLWRLHEDGFVINSSQDPSHLVEVLLTQPLAHVTQQIFLVIDGLDECQVESFPNGGSDVEQLLTTLREIPQLKMLVTSRKTPEISLTLTGLPSHEISAENSSDIGLYIAQRVASSKILSRGFAAAQINPVDYVLPKAQGIFLWAVLVLSVAERAGTGSLKRFRQSLEELPPGLNSVYEKIFERFQQDGHAPLVKELLTWIIGCGPMKLTELSGALSVSLQDEIIDLEQFLQTHVGSLVQVVSDESIVRMIHDSLNNYVTNPAVCSTDFLIDDDLIHKHIAAACLQHLTDSKPIPFTQYAGLNWMEHLKLADERDTKGLDEMVYKFFHNGGCFMWLREEVFGPQDLRLSFLHRTLDWIRFRIEKHSHEGSLISEKTEYQAWYDFSKLYGILSQSLGRLWLYGGLKDWAAVVRTFRLAAACRYASNQGRDTNFDWDKWYSRVCSGRVDPKVHLHMSVDDIILMAKENGFDASDSTCLAHLSAAFGTCGFQDPALAYIQRAVERDPSIPQFQVWLGEIYEGRGKIEAALACFSKGMALDSDGSTKAKRGYWSLKTSICLNKGDLAGGLEILKQAIEDDPENIGINHGNYFERMQRIYIELGDLESADRLCEQGVSRDPQFANSYWDDLVRAYHSIGDWAGEGRVYLRRIQSTADEDDKNMYRRHWTSVGEKYREELGDLMTSKMVLEDALERDPAGIETYFKPLAETCLCLKDWDRAISVLEMTQNRTSSVWRDIGMAQVGKGDLEGAAKSYQSAIRIDETEDDRAFARLLLGEVYMLQNREKDGENQYETIVNNCGFDHGIKAEACGDLGVCLERQGKVLEARKYYELGSNAYETVCLRNEKIENEGGTVWAHHAKARRYLGLFYEKLDRWTDAETQLRIASWQYGKILSPDEGKILSPNGRYYFYCDGHDYLSEMKADLERVRSKGSKAETGLSWMTRKERERLSKYLTFWGVDAPELTNPVERPKQQRKWDEWMCEADALNTESWLKRLKERQGKLRD